MPTLTIHDLPEDVHAALRVRAAKAGRSMEEEVRQAIAELVAPGLAGSEQPSAIKPNDTKAAVGDAEKAQLAKADSAAARLQESLRAANGGRLPVGMVEALIAERRAEVAREEEKYAQDVLDRVKWGLK
jgi:plasmid stability protein